ncbi:MAG: type II toxin-antitoxin system RelE/ParE family toxin [Leptospiraceae bacterium]|nr:type II toxin-antitoxin system RelE/ParE family toxin [Leptospiraceae bacterium]
MSNKFKIAETESFQKKLESRDFKHLKSKISEFVYPILQMNPFYGSNIKKLKGEFEGFYRFRIGKYRLFYVIQENELLVISVDIEKRKDAY